MIKKEDTNKACKKDEKGNWILRQKEFCPKHPKEKLEIKESGIYDTDYEPIRIEKELIWVPLVDCKKGERKVRYNGPLSERQEKLRKELNNLSKNFDSDGRDNDDELE
jgi:malate/lactate dehydrogenase